MRMQLQFACGSGRAQTRYTPLRQWTRQDTHICEASRFRSHLTSPCMRALTQLFGKWHRLLCVSDISQEIQERVRRWEHSQRFFNKKWLRHHNALKYVIHHVRRTVCVVLDHPCNMFAITICLHGAHREVSSHHSTHGDE